MSSTTIPQLAVLSDSTPRLMDRPVMDYFLMELVPIVRASASVAQARTQKYEQEMIDAGLLPPAPPIKPTLAGGSKAEPPSAVSRSSAAMSLGMSGGGSVGAKDKVDEEEEIVRKRLEVMGLHVGANIVERLCRDRPPFTDTLDAIKFVCKDLWSACWDKQVDNLRTNHRGVYVLQDNLFKPIARLSSWDGRADATRRARIYVAMSAGIIKGALGRLGLQATVTPEIQNLPQCTFQVKLR